MHFNPAGIANLDGLEVSSSYAKSYYTQENATKSSINIASKLSEKWAVGYSYNSFNPRQFYYFTDDVGQLLDSVKNGVFNHKIAVSFKPESTFSLGATLGVINYKVGIFTASSLQLDFGVLKKFEFSRFKNDQSINIATTVKTPMGTQLTLYYQNFDPMATLPIIMQSGVSYNYTSENKYNELEVLNLIAAVDYQTLFNSERVFNKYSTGVELTILETLHLRGGYFLESNETFGSNKNKSTVTDLTYGLGLTAPLDKLTNIPIQFSLDYCSLPQPSYIEDKTWENFQSVNASLLYRLF